MKQDPVVTGRLEVEIISPIDNRSVTVHSKQAGQGLPHDNWQNFIQKLQNAIENLIPNP